MPDIDKIITAAVIAIILTAIYIANLRQDRKYFSQHKIKHNGKIKS